MASGLAALALVSAGVAGAIAIYWFFEDTAHVTVSAVETLRWAFGLLFIGITASHLIRSGDPGQMILAFGGIVFVTLYLLIDRPWQDYV